MRTSHIWLRSIPALFLVLLLGANRLCHADPTSAISVSAPASAKSALDAREESGLDSLLSFGGFTMNSTPIEQINKNWGPGKWSSGGDAGEYWTALKYGWKGQTITFAGGELAQDIYYTVSIEEKAGGSLPAAPLKSRPAIAGLYIGMSRSDFLAGLNSLEKFPRRYRLETVKSSKRKFRRNYSRTDRIWLQHDSFGRAPHWENFDNSMYIEASFDSDRLVSLTVHNTVTD